MKLAMLAVLSGVLAAKSDPIGIYAVVDKVVMEPSEQAPERIQVIGTFALAQDRGGLYHPPVRGYLYLVPDPARRDVCLKEWADLKAVAATGQGVAFGSRFEAKPRIRAAATTPDAPDLHPQGWGISKTDRGPIHRIKMLPFLLSPKEGEAVAPGKVALSARTFLDTGDTKATYHFEIVDADGKTDAGSVDEAGDKEVRWTPTMEIKAGGKYSWRVWARYRNSTHQASSGSFTGRK
jgi:hypothetical protein